MSTHTTRAVYYPRSLPKLPTFPGPPPLTIGGEELARMVPPTPTISDFAIDFSQPLTSSEEEDEEDLEGMGQPRSCKKSKSRPQIKKCPTKKKVAPKPPSKADSTRGRAQKKRAASAQAKKAAVVPRKKGVKKAEA